MRAMFISRPCGRINTFHQIRLFFC